MATDVARASPLKNSILLDSLQLVEPAETHPPVPNHLLDTKIYRNLGQSKVVAVTPEDVHFAGFQVGKKSVADFCITNVCKDVISINILPPQSKYFKLHYKKPGLMIPGIKLNCQVEFLPVEWRYYYDCVRINCPGEENVVVPIHAYPVMNTDGFPQFYLFPPVPVGERLVGFSYIYHSDSIM
ncbi:Cilia- and flagella-associated protein 221 [Acanthosepion pharaonis]|uniref:Cilia- and flagella-associated protein 221 n=1 Tax=Acanthosepion pharaonis TaxID=158019 RepID=A0A812EVD0_ACAPH|nr:Cilia- and flagella-associated protein 221 [Sepia pharaonis]